ncbi:recombinase family protein [Paenibacillus sp. RC67]|uniref:recombinase family protein n=1 Tax=Paenibacillus sp. RC67 TaxID=3039392 RepID=UPI0024ACF905|nr:recombinase family protein [Paenibacillus sp. RC67]
MNIIHVLDKQHVSFRSIAEKFENRTPTGKFILQMIVAITELELKESIFEN